MAGSLAGTEMLERGSDASSKETVWRKGNPGRGNSLNKDQRSRKLNKWQGAGVAGEPGLFVGHLVTEKLRSRLSQVVRTWNTSQEPWQTPRAMWDLGGLRVT